MKKLIAAGLAAFSGVVSAQQTVTTTVVKNVTTTVVESVELRQEATETKTIAVFVQNRTKVAGMDDEVDGVRDRLAAALAEVDGFAVMDSAQVADTFRRYKVTVDEEASGLVPGIFTGGSVPRVAQMLGCDYIAAATIADARAMARNIGGQPSKVFTLRMTLKIMDSSGASVDSVPLPAQTMPVAGADDDPMGYYQILFDRWIAQAAPVVAQKSARWRRPAAAVAPVQFTVSTTVDSVVAALESQTKGVDVEQLQELRKVVGGATVEIDGAIAGSAPGRFAATPGLHQINVSREWMRPFTGTVNVQEGAVFEIALEMSEEGIAKWGTVEALRANVAQGYAEAAMTRGVRINLDSSNWRDVTYGGNEPTVIKQTD
ncbi:MAG: PEGA domain-containing protein [Kiritimatiellae bacterium]|nr:PEGA domain-containing protein [Kiritimatiellia bacterium]